MDLIRILAFYKKEHKPSTDTASILANIWYEVEHVNAEDQYSIDIETPQGSKLAQAIGIRTVPTVVFLKIQNGQVAKTVKVIRGQRSYRDYYNTYRRLLDNKKTWGVWIGVAVAFFWHLKK